MRLTTTIAALALAACSGANEPAPFLSELSPAELAARRLPLEPCAIERVEEKLLCGTLDVPLNRRNPGGEKLSLPVIVVPARNGNPDGLAFIEHGGGPGTTVRNLTRFYTDGRIGDRFRQSRDIVLVDQRGVGTSGALTCKALEAGRYLERYYTEEKVLACREEMTARGTDLAAYSTLESVADIEAIRKWLGYEKFDVGGWSYGSRYMLTYAHLYPESVRSMVSVVPSPFDYERPLDWARFSEAALQGLFEDCAADPPCATAFPALREDFARVETALAAAPADVTITNPETGAREARSFGPAQFIDEVHVALLKVRSSRYLPLVINAAANGDFEPFVMLAVPERAPPPVPEPLYLSVVCPEETAFFTPEEARAASENSYVGTHFTEEFKMACAIWDMPAHPDYPLRWSTLDIPALIIAGGRDPITPVEYGERIAAGFSNARFVAVPKMLHDSGGLGGSCLDDIILAFLNNPKPETLDTSCAAELTAPPFVTEPPE
jgi:pimeloyl-ACP methyl ester carboxylesterase